MSLTKKLQEDNLELKEALQKCLNYFMIEVGVQGSENESQIYSPAELMQLAEEAILNTEVAAVNQISLFGEEEKKSLSIPEVKERMWKPFSRITSTYNCVFSISRSGVINNLTIAKEELESILKELEG